ncbi:breast cancer type 2 susceptibility protein homolog [Phlebotomus argentipes]|uniref:breast cancer type 2 susceptibility protein homolog n=1 Tax=Phlebotomus argentipes TaxID=94469 RepID=UPI0028932F32|nr:breast cancer type 2 susceptibility protein homolog [Phlebotomus argentipes]
MSLSSDDEVIPPSPSPKRMKRRNYRKSLASTPSNPTELRVLRSLTSAHNEILSQRISADALDDKPRDSLTYFSSQPTKIEARMGVDFLKDLYGSASEQEAETSDPVQPALSVYTFPEVYNVRQPQKVPSNGDKIPDFAPLSQLMDAKHVPEPVAGPSGCQKPVGETQMLLYDGADHIFWDIPSQVIGPDRKRPKLEERQEEGAPNSPDILCLESEVNLPEIPVPEEEILGDSPVIKGNIDALSQTLDGSLVSSTQKPLFSARKKDFVNVQLVRKSFTDFREAENPPTTPICRDKQVSAPKRLFRDAFETSNEPQMPEVSFGGFQMANMNKIKISDETMKRVQNMFGDITGPMAFDGPGFQTANFRTPQAQPVQRESSVNSQISFLHDMDTETFLKEFDDNAFFTQMEQLKSPVMRAEEFHLPEAVKLAREEAIRLQECSVKEKPENYSENFKTPEIEKKLKSGRRKLCDFVGEELPRKSSGGINWENSLELDFESSNAVHLQFDHFTVIPNLRNRIGFPELRRAFEASKGVNPHQIPSGWTENAWKFITIKLSAMEKAFPDFFSGQLLNPGNILRQLHYRYFREIVLGHSSALKKITEHEEPANKTLVVFVLEVKSESVIVLSDGWYKITGKLDAMLTKMVKWRRISAGTKLITQGCKLVNCDEPQAPLAASATLELHGNATRRCRWDTMLGFQRQLQPQCFHLDSIHFNGGFIPRIRVCILRVYPPVLIESLRNSSVVRSERMEKRHSSQLSSKSFSNFEAVFNEMQEECAKQSSHQSFSIRNITNISGIRDPEQLIDIFNTSYDPESVENEMTASQKAILREHQQKQQEKRDREIVEVIRKRIRQQRLQRRVQKLLQLRIVDAERPDMSAMLNFWTPPEELNFKEGDFYEFSNCRAREVRNEVTFIDGPPAEEQDQNIRKLDGNLFTSPPDRYTRRITPFSELPTRVRPDFNEFDVVGIVVAIEVCRPRQNLEHVVLADAEKNLIRVFCWKGLSHFAFDDIVQPRAILCFSNLNQRLSTSLPVLAVSEATVITRNPKLPAYQGALEELRQALSLCDVEAFIAACQQKL